MIKSSIKIVKFFFLEKKSFLVIKSKADTYLFFECMRNDELRAEIFQCVNIYSSIAMEREGERKRERERKRK